MCCMQLTYVLLLLAMEHRPPTSILQPTLSWAFFSSSIHFFVHSSHFCLCFSASCVFWSSSSSLVFRIPCGYRWNCVVCTHIPIYCRVLPFLSPPLWNICTLECQKKEKKPRQLIVCFFGYIYYNYFSLLLFFFLSFTDNKYFTHPLPGNKYPSNKHSTL